MELNKAFEKAFELAKKKDTQIGRGFYEAITSKLYRHEYSWIGNNELEEVKEFLDECGFKYEITEKNRLQSKLVIR